MGGLRRPHLLGQAGIFVKKAANSGTDLAGLGGATARLRGGPPPRLHRTACCVCIHPEHDGNEPRLDNSRAWTPLSTFLSKAGRMGPRRAVRFGSRATDIRARVVKPGYDHRFHLAVMNAPDGPLWSSACHSRPARGKLSQMNSPPRSTGRGDQSARRLGNLQYACHLQT